MRIVTGVLLFVASVASLLSSAPARAQGLPILFPAPPFQLTNQDGQGVSNEDLRGKTWVVDFIFTRCPGPCPIMTSKMVALSKAVTSPDVRFVSISVDPAFDTPAVLKKYAEVRGATDPRFIFLTGDRKTIYTLAEKGFKLVAQPESARAPILHDERFLLVDGGGNVRGVYRSKDDASMAKLAVDAAAVASGAAPAPADSLAGDDAPPFVTTAPARTQRDVMIAQFPRLNASLNATAGIFLCFGMIMIKFRKVKSHSACMIAAVLSSVAFLACYLTYHYLNGGKPTRFPDGPWKSVYLTILISHTILAVVILPLIVMTLVRAWRRQWEAHRRIASPTFWLWLYVSVTGVVVYWMLYHLAPRIAAVV
jgi:protein SCO1/2/putative membrane protein